MSALLLLVPMAILMSLAGLIAFLWSLKNHQYSDIEGDARRILFDNDDDNNDNK